MWPWIELIVLVALNAVIDTVIVLVLQKRSFGKQLKNIWNDKTELEDLNGEIIKVPVTHIVKDKDGNETEKVDMVIAPLWYSVCFAVGSMVTNSVKMSVLSAKGKGARFLNKLAMDDMVEGIDPNSQALVELAGAIGGEKWRKRALVALKLKDQIKPGQAPTGGPSERSGINTDYRIK